MPWTLSLRRSLRAVNSKYIYGIPLLHTLVFLVEMAIVARLTSRFNAYYEERPLLTMMVTNTVLGGIADTTAQTIASVVHRRRTNKAYDYEAALDRRGTDDNELELQPTGFSRFGGDAADRSRTPSPFAAAPTPPTQSQSAHRPGIPFDFERLSRYMAYGFLMAPVQFRWFKFLESALPIGKGAGTLAPTLKRTALDQLVFAPVGIACFFTAMTVSEGGGRRAVVQKLRDAYVPTLKANYLVWPAVQLVNFRLMPVQFQLPFVSTVGIAWTAYLSLTNAAEDVALNRAHVPDAPSVRLD